MSNHLPGLVYRPGLATWRPAVDRAVVMDFPTYEDYLNSIPESKRADVKMLPSHWPPSPAEAAELHLDRWYVKLIMFPLLSLVDKPITLNLSMRIYPHLQDTGGCFVAVLQKTPASTAQQEQA